MDNRNDEIKLSKQFIQDLKTVKTRKLKVYCHVIRDKIVEVCSKNGGHLSSNLGVVELTVALFRKFDFDNDDVIFDVGHQTYTYKLITERDLVTLRKFDGIHAFQNFDESSYDKISAGHSSTSLSVGYAYAKYKQLNNIDTKTIVVIGDSSLTSGMAMEALNQIAADKTLKNFIIVINDNGMSISKPTGAVAKRWSKLRNSSFYVKSSAFFKKIFNSSFLTRWFYLLCKKVKDIFKRIVLNDNFIEALGINYIGPIDGHDVGDMERSFARCNKNKSPTVVHVLTTKGKGYKKAEVDEEGFWHGVTPFNIETGESNISDENNSSFTKLVGKNIYNYMHEDEKAIVINPAMVNGSYLIKTFKNYKDRTFDVGIAEEHAVTFASGFAKKGSHVFVSIYSTFLQRSYDQISHDVARLHLPVVFLVERAGLVGADGETHQGIYDVAFLNSIPDVDVVMPYDYPSLLSCFSNEIFAKNRPTFIRITRNSILNSEIKDVKFNEPKLEKKKHETLVIASGFYGNSLLKKLNNVDTIILFDLLPTKEKILSLIPQISEYKNIIVVDQYSIYEGTCSQVQKILNQLKFDGEFNYFCIDKTFIMQGTINEQLKYLNLDETCLIKRIEDVVNKQN